MTKKPSISPAVYSKELIEPLAEALAQGRDNRLMRGKTLLDPFAGLGHGLASIADALGMVPLGVEIEPGYFFSKATHPCVILGDSRSLPFGDATFDAAVTSSPYPNGVSDSFHAQDLSRRNTYVHRLRAHLGADYELQEGNSGGLNPRRSPKALAAFYAIHEAVWAEVYRVLKPGALFVVNTKDPLNVAFRTDTQHQLARAGFEFISERQVSVRGLNHGKNAELKYGFEDVSVVRRPWGT